MDGYSIINEPRKCGNCNREACSGITGLCEFPYPWESGEENEQMTTGENTTNENVRALFPRVSFREVEDAEMVVAVLRNSSIDMVKRVAQAIQVMRISKTINQIGVVTAVMTNQHGKETDGHSVIEEMLIAAEQMVGMVEAITGQLAAMYGTPDEENAKYISSLLDFVTDTRVVMVDIANTNNTLKSEER